MDPRDVLDALDLPQATPVALAGGDVSRVSRCGEWVVKTHDAPAPGLFASEARGLALLARHGVPVPEVAGELPDALVIRYLPPGPPEPRALGGVIARMHQVQGPHFGTSDPVYLGRVRQPAITSDDGSEVMRVRCAALLEEATALGPLAHRVRRALDRWPAHPGPPVLTHGDLWSGNVHHAATGPHLIDPAATWGAPALDVAMMQLFGGFGRDVWAGYEEVAPRPDERAVRWHQLPFLLVHVAMFGSGYVPATARWLDDVGA